jgi:hypothetical protein
LNTVVNVIGCASDSVSALSVESTGGSELGSVHVMSAPAGSATPTATSSDRDDLQFESMEHLSCFIASGSVGLDAARGHILDGRTAWITPQQNSGSRPDTLVWQRTCGVGCVRRRLVATLPVGGFADAQLSVHACTAAPSAINDRREPILAPICRRAIPAQIPAAAIDAALAKIAPHPDVRERGVCGGRGAATDAVRPLGAGIAERARPSPGGV